MVRALLIGTGYRTELEPLVQYRPTLLFHIADRPILFHIIEFLVRQGIKKIDLLLHHLPQLVEAKLFEGKRWGISVTYHLSKYPDMSYMALGPVIQGWEEEHIVLGSADCLPKFSQQAFANLQDESSTLFYYPSQKWSGWAILPSKVLADVPKNIRDDDLPSNLVSGYKKQQVIPYLAIHDFESLKNSNQTFIREDHSFHLFPTTAHMVEPGVWISRAVTIHPNAKIASPVFIGENTQIASHVEIGPNTIIENNCMIDYGTKIGDALICQHSYVGEKLEIINGIVNRNLLVSLSHKSKITLHDDFILSELSVSGSISKTLYFAMERLCALGLFIVFLPVFLVLWLSLGLKREQVLCLPASDDPEDWKTFNIYTFHGSRNAEKWRRFFLRFPSLLNIIFGDVHFVGVNPRTIQAVEALPQDWRRMYLRSKLGLITLVNIDVGPNPSEDAIYAAETYYAIHMCNLFDLTLSFRWLKKKIVTLFSRS